MQPIDNSQFTEEQRVEAYRVESIQQMRRQTQALETIRTVLVIFTVLFLVGAVSWAFIVARSTA